MFKDLFNKAFDAVRGRHTFFTMAFFVTGNVLHWFHRLDGTYIGYMSTLMGFVLGRSISQDVTSMPPTPPPPPPPPAQPPVVQIQTGSPPPPMVPPPPAVDSH